MGIVQFPGAWAAGQAERQAVRHGMRGRMSTARPLLRVVVPEPAGAFCAACAAPVDFGAVWRGREVYCSVECSLGGNRPA